MKRGHLREILSQAQNDKTALLVRDEDKRWDCQLPSHDRL